MYNKNPVLKRFWTGKSDATVYRAWTQPFTTAEAHSCNLLISKNLSRLFAEYDAENHVLESRLLSLGYTGSSETQPESQRHAPAIP